MHDENESREVRTQHCLFALTPSVLLNHWVVQINIELKDIEWKATLECPTSMTLSGIRPTTLMSCG